MQYHPSGACRLHIDEKNTNFASHLQEKEEATASSSFLISEYMIDKTLLINTVKEALEGTDMFFVDARVTPSNEITVEIDSASGVDIDTCAAITRKIESVFDRDVEDYELEVGSAGLTSPFKVYGQYAKNIGNDVEVLTRDGRKIKGVLAAVAPENPSDPCDVSFTVTVQTKVKEPGAKRPVLRDEPVELRAADCKSVKYLIKF